MVIDNNRIRNLLIGILIVLILLTVCISVDYASNDTIKTVKNQTKMKETNVTMINGTYYSKEIHEKAIIKMKHYDKVHYVHPEVTIIAKPSCGCGKHYPYRWRTRTFINYCPHCHRYGVLKNVHKPQAKWEQELTCTHCGGDYCGNCGHEKYSWSKYYLTKA